MVILGVNFALTFIHRHFAQVLYHRISFLREQSYNDNQLCISLMNMKKPVNWPRTNIYLPKRTTFRAWRASSVKWLQLSKQILLYGSYWLLLAVRWFHWPAEHLQILFQNIIDDVVMLVCRCTAFELCLFFFILDYLNHLHITVGESSGYNTQLAHIVFYLVIEQIAPQQDFYYTFLWIQIGFIPMALSNSLERCQMLLWFYIRIIRW